MIKSFSNMNRVRRISSDLLQRYPEKFTTDFSENKKISEDEEDLQLAE